MYQHIGNFAVFLLVLGLGYVNAQTGSIYTTLMSHKDLSKIRELVDKSASMKSKLQSSTSKYMFFAPNNTAIDSLSQTARSQFLGLRDDLLIDRIKYHMVIVGEVGSESGTITDNERKNSMARNSPPLFFKVESYMGQNHQYVNGALITKTFTCLNGWVYVIDKVFWEDISFQSAWGFLSRPAITGVKNQFNNFEQLFTGGGHGMEELEQILNNNEEKVTLFLPLDQAVTIKLRQTLSIESESLKSTLQAHIIRHAVYYTSFMRDNEETNSMKDGDEIKFTQVWNRNAERFETYVSNRNGVAKIVNGNITVTNGVVHIIDKLMWYIPQDFTASMAISEDAFARTFYEMLLNSDVIREILNQRDGQQQVTVFIPTPEAFSQLKAAASSQGQRSNNERYMVILPNLDSNQTARDNMLRMHIVENEKIWRRDMFTEGKRYRTMGQGAQGFMKFSHFENETYVSAGHQVAKVMQSRMDIGVINGVIHYIDTVLGFPFRTIRQEIEQNPRLNLLREQLEALDRLNTQDNSLLDMLGDVNRRFTIFAPNNTAFERILNITCIRYTDGRCSDYGKGFAATGGITSPEFANPYKWQWTSNDPYSSTREIVNSDPNTVGNTDCNYPNANQLDARCQNRQLGNEFGQPQFTAQQVIGQQLLLDPGKRGSLDYVLRRMIVENPFIYLDTAPQGETPYRSMAGVQVTVYKRGNLLATDDHYELRYGDSLNARVVQADIGMLNGVVHIVNDVIYEQGDLARQVSGVPSLEMAATVFNITGLLHALLLMDL